MRYKAKKKLYKVLANMPPTLAAGCPKRNYGAAITTTLSQPEVVKDSWVVAPTPLSFA